MFLRNKFLLFLLTCTIANPCFGDECSGTTLFCPDDSGQLILNQTQWNVFSNNISKLSNYIDTSANAFDALLNAACSDPTDTECKSIQAKINALGETKISIDALINGTTGTGSATNPYSLVQRIELLSTNLDALQTVIGNDGTGGAAVSGLWKFSADLASTKNEIDKSLIKWNQNWQNIQIRPIINIGCAQGYYVAQCDDINLDLGTILGYVMEYYNIDPLCWNQGNPYEEMRYLLHLKGVIGTTADGKDITDDNATYTSAGSAFRDYFNTSTGHNCGDISDSESGLYQLQELRKNIFDTCMNKSFVCKKCPNDGTTDVKTERVLTTYKADGTVDKPAHWKSFNTIADCFTVGGSDAKGTFTLTNPWTTNNKTGDKCHYEY